MLGSIIVMRASYRYIIDDHLNDDMMMDHLHFVFYSDVVFWHGMVDCATGTTDRFWPEYIPEGMM